MDAGYFYCPYVTITKNPVMLDPETAPTYTHKDILTRYGKRRIHLSKIQNLADYRNIVLGRKNEK